MATTEQGVGMSPARRSRVDATQWPSLCETMNINSPIPSDTSWEMVSPERHSEQVEETDDHLDDHIVLVPRPKVMPLRRQRSSSTPDLLALRKGSVGEEHDEGDDFFAVDDSVSASKVANASANKTAAPSFRDMVLASLRDEIVSNAVKITESNPKRTKAKTQPKYVVTPIRRCSASTPNLRALAAAAEDDEIVGESDATEYYNLKAMGYMGRKNGLKVRPDEAKRKDITMYKKELQRQEQSKRG